MRARFINEMSLESLDVKDIVTKDLYNQWRGDNFLDELFLYSYADEHGKDLEDLIDSDFVDTKEFEEWYKYEMESLFHETFNKFHYDILNGLIIPIWRAITVKDNWVNHLEKFGGRLGIYWSWDKNAAEPHWGYDNGKISILIESEVNVDHIDWIETIQLNMHPSYKEEKEIRLFKNTPLKIKRLEINEEEIDISNVQNKIFKA